MNPLLQIEFRVPFDRIKAEHVQPAIDDLLRDARERVESIANLQGPRTFDNTMHPLDRLTDRVDYAMSVVRHLEAVATYPELRAAYNAVQPAVTEFYAGIPLHAGLWKALQDYAATAEARELTGAKQRFLKKTIENFRRHGAELDEAGKRKLSQLDVELGRLTMKFSENVLDSTNAWELIISDERRLAGLPPSAVTAARESAESKGMEGWRFTLQAPSYIALMTYLDDAGLREQAYRAYNARASFGEHDNRDIIRRVLELRAGKARLLGYADFAGLVLEDRMAHTAENAGRFLEEMKDKTEPHFRRENLELEEFRRKLEGGNAPALEPWDIAYYAEKLRASLYEFDEEALRPYFPLEPVVAGMFEIFRRVFGIRVERQEGVPGWDPQVRFYNVYDDAKGSWLGAFYADFYPRENKRGGAWMDALITGGPVGEGFEPHLGLICGNLTPPAGGKPALLTHREVETIFHEFGHLLHHCLSEVEIRTLAGTSVAWDFVELPSQIMENWCWERVSLDLFARHFETGEPIPEDLYQRMVRARNFRAANAQMRQLSFGVMDLSLHTGYSPERDGDPIDYTRGILQQFSPARLREDHAMAAGFTHLFASPVGYGAGYYSYKWAEVLDADAFTRFKQCGVFSRECGGEFRERILSKGNSADPAELYRAFMGRDPDPNALLERSGLLARGQG